MLYARAGTAPISAIASIATNRINFFTPFLLLTKTLQLNKVCHADPDLRLLQR